MAEADKPNRHTVNKIFGDALPEIARDERDTASPEDESEHDRWLRRNVPPHHE